MFRSKHPILRMWSVLLFTVVAHCALPSIKQTGQERIKIVNALYEGSFSFTLEKVLEFHFPVRNDGYTIDSSSFPSNDPNGMTWYIRTEVRTRRNSKDLDIHLTLGSLPKGASYLFATCQSFLIDAAGQPQLLRNHSEVKFSRGTRFYAESIVKRDVLESSANELLPDGNLNIQFHVKGFIV